LVLRQLAAIQLRGEVEGDGVVKMPQVGWRSGSPMPILVNSLNEVRLERTPSLVFLRV
jgi:hypothetical protein